MVADVFVVVVVVVVAVVVAGSTVSLPTVAHQRTVAKIHFYRVPNRG